VRKIAFQSSKSKIALPAYVFIADEWIDHVTVQGTWVGEPTNEQFPLETSHLFCDRPRMVCYESLAYIYSGNLPVLQTDLVFWELSSRNDREIVSKPDQRPRLFNVLRINRASKKVAQVQTVTKDCRALGLTKGAKSSLQLVDGQKLFLKKIGNH
jgi:hypothetical protein